MSEAAGAWRLRQTPVSGSRVTMEATALPTSAQRTASASGRRRGGWSFSMTSSRFAQIEVAADLEVFTLPRRKRCGEGSKMPSGLL